MVKRNTLPEHERTRAQEDPGSHDLAREAMESHVQKCTHMEAHSTCELVDDLMNAHENQPKSRGHHTHA